jgi:RNA polymerase sigma-70 factor (ECF subfamily)
MGFELALPATMGRGAEASDARFRSMVEAHVDAVWRLLRRLRVPADAAPDGVQKVFMVALRRMSEIEAGGERRYLLGIALHVASEMRRAIERRREVSIEELGGEHYPARAGENPPEEALDNKRALALASKALDEMPAQLREAFVLFELEELSAPDVAELLRIPIGTVASRVRRAREIVRQKLTEGGAP